MRGTAVVSFAFAFFTSASSALAATIIVDPGGGGQFTDLQAAISFAQPGDLIRVIGGTYPFVTISKPLTIIAQPRATILPPPPFQQSGQFNGQDPAVLLNGTGSGVVTLVNLAIGGPTDIGVYCCAEAAIQGGGFAELHVVDSNVIGPQPFQASGGFQGRPAISTTVPRVVIASSTITGGPNDNDFCLVGFFPYNGPAGIDAAQSDVILLDSTVTGGAAGPPVCFDVNYLPPTFGPCPCTGIAGVGGPGVVANRVFRAGSVLLGGAGGCFEIVGTFYQPWGCQPDGPPVVAQTDVPFEPDAFAWNGPTLGNTYQLAFISSNSPLLFVGQKPGAPLHLPQYGWFFVDPTQPFVATGYTCCQLSVPVPNVSGLIGIEVTLQVWSPIDGFTRPIIAVINAP